MSPILAVFRLKVWFSNLPKFCLHPLQSFPIYFQKFENKFLYPELLMLGGGSLGRCREMKEKKYCGEGVWLHNKIYTFSSTSPQHSPTKCLNSLCFIQLATKIEHDKALGLFQDTSSHINFTEGPKKHSKDLSCRIISFSVLAMRACNPSLYRISISNKQMEIIE